MLNITEDKIAELKGKGFILMKDKEHFNARLVVPAGVLEADKMIKICDIAKKYGTGY